MMAETAFLAESAIHYPTLFDQLRQLTTRPTETVETLAMSAVAASIEQSAGAIIVLSTSSAGLYLLTVKTDLQRWFGETHLQVSPRMPDHLWCVK